MQDEQEMRQRHHQQQLPYQPRVRRTRPTQPQGQDVYSGSSDGQRGQWGPDTGYGPGLVAVEDKLNQFAEGEPHDRWPLHHTNQSRQADFQHTVQPRQSKVQRIPSAECRQCATKATSRPITMGRQPLSPLWHTYARGRTWRRSEQARTVGRRCFVALQPVDH